MKIKNEDVEKPKTPEKAQEDCINANYTSEHSQWGSVCVGYSLAELSLE